MGTENNIYLFLVWNRPPLPFVVCIFINFDETKYKQRIKMSSKKLIRGGDFNFQMTETSNFWSYICSFKIGPLQISSPVLHGGYFCWIVGSRVKKPLLWTFFALAAL